MSTVWVELGEGRYPVHLEETLGGLPAALGRAVEGRRAVLITEPRVEGLWGARVTALLAEAGWTLDKVLLPEGEAAKSVDAWWEGVGGLLAAGVDRQTAVIALGGGALGDAAGLIAATALRGLRWVQLPTTLLAMVDASVGGKTAINHPRGKNLVGAFHQPAMVFAATEVLATLPEVQRASGLAEVVKVALMLDAGLLAAVEARAGALRRGEPAALRGVVARAVALKAGIVARDPTERGVRTVLNAGHTVGHAVESISGMPHGQAVGIGLLAELRWAERAGLCTATGLSDRLEALLLALGLPVSLPPLTAKALFEGMLMDKKRSADTICLPVPTQAGEAALVRVTVSELSEFVGGLG
ncbi:MAG: 3-dehydroquinate synthase [Deltaproteobacteria bacterium]|nr:3-dehydroquinate synthase [Deltaproteobacteria bacterium]